MKNSFLNPDEIKQLNLASVGKNVQISRKASFYTPEVISIGDATRIDDFCIITTDIWSDGVNQVVDDQHIGGVSEAITGAVPDPDVGDQRLRRILVRRSYRSW